MGRGRGGEGEGRGEGSGAEGRGRGREVRYLEGLLKPNEDTRDNNFSAQNILEHESEILRSEVEESARGTRNRRNKHRDNKSSRRSRCRTAVESMQAQCGKME